MPALSAAPNYSTIGSLIASIAMIGCGPPRGGSSLAPRNPEAVSYEYRTIKAADTLAFELVTSCPRRIIADVQSRNPTAHLHYEAELSEEGMPTMLSVAIWLGTVYADAPPMQILRRYTSGDTTYTEVWGGSDSRLQKSVATPVPFPLFANFLGLIAQLTDVLGRRTNDSLPIAYVAIGDRTGWATARSLGEDSLLVTIDGLAMRARWDAARGFQGGIVPASGARFERSLVADVPQANARCAKPGFLRPAPGGRGYTVTMNSN